MRELWGAVKGAQQQFRQSTLILMPLAIYFNTY